MSEILQVNIQLSEEAFILFKTEDDYKDHCKKQMALQLAEKLLESKYTTFTYIKDPLTFGATLKARIELP